ncbi:class I SAM-dependent methyltransferase [Candidatus Enterococcus mansonii]|uniref:Methyltransferase type 11 domain-containing protein n=1 Tax=Candidatus Enterococcus mansonii TaxID=1834181 RepID=A0A242CIZ9_9ENTE|nr:class I SAM-dependent methyltransferase [Enterococcus sp. 4G2_DIV0659]OTO10181.1 hypothetical protein A5880_000864 [Enterococcus sp. 4G2_DIV0659]
MFLVITALVIVLLVFLFKVLMKQSKNPSGFIGYLMMYLWNSVYLPLVRWSLNSIHLAERQDILDIGVGNGASSVYLLQQTHALSVTGIDHSKDAITQAKKRWINEPVQFETIDVHELPYPSETFDLITAFQTHFHWDDFDQAINEIYNVLKQQGIVLFACETSKIDYFLPEFKHPEHFKAYMSTQGFIPITQNSSKQWIMYAFKKNK